MSNFNACKPDCRSRLQNAHLCSDAARDVQWHQQVLALGGNLGSVADEQLDDFTVAKKRGGMKHRPPLDI